MSGPLVWLITGTSAGLGRLMTLEALKRGDKVIATARGRSVEKLNELKEKGADVLELEVTAPLEELHEVAKKAIAIHGRVDVLVNNAGYLAGGALEETTPKETYDQFNTNIFGGLNVARAFLPYMRPRKTGTVVWIGSIAGWEGVAGAGLYGATKSAVRTISMAMDNELQPLGLRSMNFEFGYFRTTFLAPSQRTSTDTRIADYDEVCGAVAAALVAYDGKQPSDPVKGIKIMVDLIRGEGIAEGRKVPHTIQFGSDTLKTVKEFCAETTSRIEEWGDVFASTDFPKGT
ncbi:NAD(P)-binding protein [Dentipellis sp. KUC8613]|nr:NAD(P)-binding protein [Dentipellis sp. KUC8613]